MKRFILSSLLLFLVLGCKQNDNKALQSTQEVKAKTNDFYPDDLAKVFAAHGGVDQWKKMNQLSYELPKKTLTEKHLIDLKTRKIVISSDKYTIGFDGNEVWMNKEGTFPIDRARFYHNLYFYFYAMPFVISDKGINYEKVPNLEINGKSLSGYKISYKGNIGDSPEDNYFIYYNSTTYKMEWLGYTVTYGANKPSAEIHYINYANWQRVNGLLLPKELQWYSTENNLPFKKTNSQLFEAISVLDVKPETKLFEKPKDALIGKK